MNIQTAFQFIRINTLAICKEIPVDTVYFMSYNIIIFELVGMTSFSIVYFCMFVNIIITQTHYLLPPNMKSA